MMRAILKSTGERGITYYERDSWWFVRPDHGHGCVYDDTPVPVDRSEIVLIPERVIRVTPKDVQDALNNAFLTAHDAKRGA